MLVLEKTEALIAREREARIRTKRSVTLQVLTVSGAFSVI